MAPIRVGIIGLSANSFSSWGATSHLPYLISDRGQKNYEITALLNSSADAAASAREHFKLPSSVNTYGAPEDLAADPNVDLVVCVTFVGHHFKTLAPSLAAGKRAFVEWPLVTSLADTTTLQMLASSPNVLENSIIGLQGRISPAIRKLGELLSGGKIGSVLSSDVNAVVKLLPVPEGTLPEPAAFMADKTKGANMVTVGYGHTIDYIHAVLGEWDAVWARTQVQRAELTLLGADPQRSVISNVPDLIVVHGTVKGKDYVSDDATLSVNWRSGLPFKGDPALVWNIRGEKGEVQLVSHSSPLIGAEVSDEAITLKVQLYDTDEVEAMSWSWEEWQTTLPVISRNTAALYDEYAAWARDEFKESSKGATLATLNDAAVRMRDINDLLFPLTK